MVTTTALLDTQALARLGEQLGDPAVLSAFVRRFDAMLGPRVDRLHRALVTRDTEAWVDAVLSLKSASSMVGAVALSRMATQLEQRFGQRAPATPRWPDAAGVEQIMATLRRLATETSRQLQRFVERVERNSAPSWPEP